MEGRAKEKRMTNVTKNSRNERNLKIFFTNIRFFII